MALGTARAVFAAKRQPDIVPARVILPHGQTGGIKHDPALRIGHVDVILVTHFMDPADIGAERALMKLGKGLCQLALLRMTRKQIITSDFGQQGRGID